MAKITVEADDEQGCIAWLSEPDEDGEYTWHTICPTGGSEPGRTDTMEDAIQHMSAHVDSCPFNAVLGTPR